MKKYLLILSIAGASAVNAATITWSAPKNITGDSDVSTAGSLVQASNVSGPSTTVNGVTFTAFPTGGGSATSGVFTLTGAYGDYDGYLYGNAAFTAPYAALLSTGNYGSLNSIMTLTISSLEVGTRYQFQVWINDSRGNYLQQPVHARAGNDVRILGNVSGSAGDSGQYAIGTFVADATTQTIEFQGENGTGTVENAFMLRAVRDDLPVPPAHGGLSSTRLTVNGSSSPAYPPAAPPVNGLTDTVLQFTAQQTGTPAGLSVRIQGTTTPNVESSWTDLPNSTNGRMTFDPADQQFLLSSNEYPHQQADPVYFRAVASAPSYPDSISNVVGPFNLTSATPRISSRLDFTGNGSGADLYFRATESATPAGISVRVQASTTPGQEGSWSDLNNGNAGHMTQSTDPKQFLLLVNNYPTTKGVYFRAIASGQGFVDSISNLMGPYDITATVPPVVNVTTAKPLAGSGDGHDSKHPIILSADNGAFAAGVRSTTAVKTVKLEVDGHTVTEYPGSSDPNAIYIAYFTPTVGDHVYECVAINDLGATARAGTGGIFVRVIPSQSSAKAERTGDNGFDTIAAAKGQVYTASNDGNWNDPRTWTNNADGSLGVPGPNDFAIINSATVIIDSLVADAEVGSLSINGGAIATPPNGDGVLKVDRTMTIAGGRIDRIHLAIPSTCQVTMLNDVDFPFFGTVSTTGNWTIHGAGGLVGLYSFSNSGNFNFSVPLHTAPNVGIDPAAALRVVHADLIPNLGQIGGTVSAIIGNDGASLITNDGGSLITNDGGSIVASGAGNIVASGAGNIVASGAGNIVASGAGNIVASGAGNIISTNSGGFSHPQQHAASAASGFSQTGGETNLSACTIVGAVTLDGGTLSGTGFIQGDLTNNGGYISPGHSAGALGVLGNFTQGSSGTTIIEAGGGRGGDFDSLQVGGTANLGGTLNLKLINGYKPDPSDKLNPVSYTNAAGAFNSVSSNAQVSVNSTGLSATVDPAKLNPKGGQPVNIATRLAVQTGDNVLIAGFIVTGPPGSTKKIVIRGLGPSLAVNGVKLSDPLLELNTPDAKLVNDNWRDGDTSQIPDGFAPGSDKESIIVTNLTVGADGLSSYTAILRGAHDEIGIGSLEVYDLETGSAAQLVNIATRGVVQTGDNVLIGGFIVAGSEPAKMLVRVTGPASKVTGALQDPVLEVHDSNGAAITNDNWRETQEAEITATGIAPKDDREPAVLATLVPGAYTAVVLGANDSTGVAVVEAYNLQ